MSSRLAIMFCLLGTLGPLGCGGDSDSESGRSEGEATAETTTNAAPTKAEFIVEGDDVCRDFREATEDVREDEPSDYDALAEQAAQIREEAEKAMERFRALTPPPGDEQIVEQYASSIEESLALFRRLEAAADEEDAAKIETYSDDLRELSQRQRGLA